jgi:FkbM family methyltransferase
VSAAAGGGTARVRDALRSLWHVLPGKRGLFELWRRAGAPPERIWRHLHFEGDFEVRLGAESAFRMRHFGALVENDLFWAGYGNGWEGTSLRLWTRLVPHAATILDIGANTGAYALAAATLNPAARVMAFEPAPQIARRLRQNVAMNRLAIEVVEAGVSDRTDTAILHEPEADHSYSASLEPAMVQGQPGLRRTSIAVTRLDDFAAAHHLGRLELLKIDAEMHEVPILDGLGRRLAEDRPAMLIEVLTPRIGAEVMQRIEGLGYALFRIDEGKGVVSVASLAAARANHLLCVPELAAALGIDGGATHASLAMEDGS